MLDTNAASDAIRNPSGSVAARLSAPGVTASVSIVVASELRYGVELKGSGALSKRVETVLSAFEIEPLSTPFDQFYARLRRQLERAGTPLQANDLLIAAHALTLQRVLVTDDRGFGRVPGLPVENWLR